MLRSLELSETVPLANLSLQKGLIITQALDMARLLVLVLFHLLDVALDGLCQLGPSDKLIGLIAVSRVFFAEQLILSL